MTVMDESKFIRNGSKETEVLTIYQTDPKID